MITNVKLKLEKRELVQIHPRIERGAARKLDELSKKTNYSRDLILNELINQAYEQFMRKDYA